ncbi:MAG: hypothetical protein LC645_04440 [Geobacteraceae bacterium]|nr:hypothetical protein [Geobacteraceae bacterium]
MNTKAEHPMYKRKHLNVKVKSEFQRWLLWRIFGVVLLSALVAALVLYFYARHETISTFYDAHIEGMAGEVNRTLEFMHKEVENMRELQQQIRSALDAGDTTCARELLQRQEEMLQRLLEAEE